MSKLTLRNASLLLFTITTSGNVMVLLNYAYNNVLRNNALKWLNQKDTNGNTVLHKAIKDVDISLFNSTLNSIKKYGTQELLDIRNNEGLTAMHIAIIDNKKEFIQPLISAGANYNLTVDGQPPVFLAIDYGYLNIVEHFIDDLKLDVNARNEQGSTLLHEAVIARNADLVEYLLKQPGIDVDAQNINDETALDLILADTTPENMAELVFGFKADAIFNTALDPSHQKILVQLINYPLTHSLDYRAENELLSGLMLELSERLTQGMSLYDTLNKVNSRLNKMSDKEGKHKAYEVLSNVMSKFASALEMAKEQQQNSEDIAASEADYFNSYEQGNNLNEGQISSKDVEVSASGDSSNFFENMETNI